MFVQILAYIFVGVVNFVFPPWSVSGWNDFTGLCKQTTVYIYRMIILSATFSEPLADKPTVYGAKLLLFTKSFRARKSEHKTQQQLRTESTIKATIKGVIDLAKSKSVSPRFYELIGGYL
jgi:hypothetical protein